MTQPSPPRDPATPIHDGGTACCSSCRFGLFSDNPEEPLGFCLRYAPRPFQERKAWFEPGEYYERDERFADEALWPEVARGCWCGEHQPRRSLSQEGAGA